MLVLLAMLSLTASWLVPNHYFPWNSFYNESCAALAVLLLSVGLGRRWLDAPSPPSVWFVAAAAAIPGLQWAFGLLHFSGDVFVSTLYVVGLAAAIAAGHAWARSDRDNAMLGLGTAMFVGGLLSAALAIAQALEVRLSSLYVMDAIRSMRAYANLGQPNNLATLLAFGAVGLLFRAPVA